MKTSKMGKSAMASKVNALASLQEAQGALQAIPQRYDDDWRPDIPGDQDDLIEMEKPQDAPEKLPNPADNGGRGSGGDDEEEQKALCQRTMEMYH